MGSEDEILTAKEVADMLKIKNAKTISNWVYEGREDFPAGFKLGKSPSAGRRWYRSEIEKYLKLMQERSAA